MRQPPAKVKNRQIAFVFCFGLHSVWQRSTTLRIHQSHSCHFFYRVRASWRLFPYHKGQCHWMGQIEPMEMLHDNLSFGFNVPLRFFRVWVAIPSEYMPLSQAFSVTSHILSCNWYLHTPEPSQRRPYLHLLPRPSRLSGKSRIQVLGLGTELWRVNPTRYGAKNLSQFRV